MGRQKVYLGSLGDNSKIIPKSASLGFPVLLTVSSAESLFPAIVCCSYNLGEVPCKSCNF